MPRCGRARKRPKTKHDADKKLDFVRLTIKMLSSRCCVCGYGIWWHGRRELPLHAIRIYPKMGNICYQHLVQFSCIFCGPPSPAARRPCHPRCPQIALACSTSWSDFVFDCGRSAQFPYVRSPRPPPPARPPIILGLFFMGFFLSRRRLAPPSTLFPCVATVAASLAAFSTQRVVVCS